MTRANHNDSSRRTRSAIPHLGCYLQKTRHLNIDGANSIELEYPPQPDKIEEWVSEAYCAIDELLSEVGLRG